MEKYQPCQKCINSALKGFILRRDGTAEECECHITWRRREGLRIDLEEAGIPVSIIDKSFHDYKGTKSLHNIEKLKKYVGRFKEVGYKKCLYLHGPHGTQKTTLSHVVGKELLSKGVSVFYIRAMDLIVKHFGNFNPTDVDKKFISDAEESDVVIIDECFARKRHESVGDYQLVQLRNFLKNRLETLERSTIFISNYPVEEITKQGFDKGIYDLIKRNTSGKVLLFEDNYMAEKTDFDIDELFT